MTARVAEAGFAVRDCSVVNFDAHRSWLMLEHTLCHEGDSRKPAPWWGF
jgi:hypothetical protein